MKKFNIDACIGILRKVGEVAVKSNHAAELVKSLGGKLDGSLLHVGEVKIHEDGLYRIVYC